MTRRTWIACLLISLLAAVLAPILTLTPLVPVGGPVVLDQGASAQKADAVVQVRRVEGWERFTWWLDHPEMLPLAGEIYGWTALKWFVVVFGLSVFVAYATGRRRRER